MVRLFKMMLWAGAVPLLLVGSFLLIGAFIPLYTNMKIKANAMNPGQFVFVITLSMYVIVLTSLLAMNVSGPVIERFVTDNADDSRIINYFEKKKARLTGAMANDSTQASQLENKKLVMESATKTKALINSLRIDLVEHVENVNEVTAKELILHPDLITRKDNYDIVNHFLLSLEEPNQATVLKTAIENYRSIALKASANDPILTNKINGLLNTNTGNPSERTTTSWGQVIPKNWEEHNFRNNMLISTLGRLSEIEKNICLIETEVLTLKN